MIFPLNTHCPEFNPSGFRVRTDLAAGSPNRCLSYCVQEYDRCRVSGLPQATCDDRLPVCQNACDVCAITGW